MAYLSPVFVPVRVYQQIESGGAAIYVGDANFYVPYRDLSVQLAFGANEHLFQYGLVTQLYSILNEAIPDQAISFSRGTYYDASILTTHFPQMISPLTQTGITARIIYVSKVSGKCLKVRTGTSYVIYPDLTSAINEQNPLTEGNPWYSSNDHETIAYIGTMGGGRVASSVLYYTEADTNGKPATFNMVKYRYDSQNTIDLYSDHYFNSNGNSGLMLFFNDSIPLTPAGIDPYAEGGISGTGGGTGTFDGSGDSVDIPSLPTLSAVDAGFITLFNPTTSQMSALATYMWANPLFDLSAWKKIFADPMQAILGLSIVPVAVPDGGLRTVKVGNISTDVYMTVAASQYVEVDCGSIDVSEYWGAYLDYAPYTKAEIYLPYIGIHAISIDDIMGKTVRVVYHIDILSGSCCAYVKCGSSVLYSFVGQCASSVPITGDNWTNVINGALTIAGSIGAMAATGGSTAPTTISSIASTAINNFKPEIEKSGSMSGTGGMLGVQTPYLIITRPRQALPENQNGFIGYPSFITVTLSDISGYTEVEKVHLENISATSEEMEEIERLLSEGVIF